MTETAPIIVLVNPQMGENIGAAARAMLNCGLTQLRLVNPRDGWPSTAAEAMAVGAFEKMPPVGVFDSLGEAIGDCHFVYATTARRRDMEKPVLTPQEAAAAINERHAQDQKTAILFGAERSGLENDEIALAHAVVTAPLNPDFSSLNLAQSVLLMAYEWRIAGLQGREPQKTNAAPPASRAIMIELFERLETELETHHFFRSGGQKPFMIRNLRNMLSRAEMTEQEAATFHGVISALIGKKKI